MTKAATTRFNILEKAFDLIYKNGYQTTSIDDIIATTKVTKGAFYYHFKNKDEMGLAIINEIVRPTMHEAFILPLQLTTDPLEQIFYMFKSLLVNNTFLKAEYGCPVGNLAQEMTPWHTEFHKALHELILDWQSAIEKSLKVGIQNGLVRDTVNPQRVGYFVISSYWGIRNFGKLSPSSSCYTAFLDELKYYLESLR